MYRLRLQILFHETTNINDSHSDDIILSTEG